MRKEKTFYQSLCDSTELDRRDNRGKRHQLGFILLGFVIGMFRNQDGNLSAIHDSMKDNNEGLCAALETDIQRVVSRPHLPRVLARVDLEEFDRLLFDSYEVHVPDVSHKWFAGDGKELRGSIAKGERRGEAIVQLVAHEDGQTVAQTFYDGSKASEKPALRELIESSGLQRHNISADALHLNPALTELIHRAGGTYLIGLKGNQKILLADLCDRLPELDCELVLEDNARGHGRIEQRRYTVYDIRALSTDKRWADSNLQMLIRVERVRKRLCGKELGRETAYYLSNAHPARGVECCHAIRNHWSVEVSNHYRDVTLSEDQFRTKNRPLNRLAAACRTLVMRILSAIDVDNKRRQLRLFQNDFNALISTLKTHRFL